jgi:hypothetical protein
VDFKKRFAPVIDDRSIRNVCIANLIWGFQASMVYAEAAFLHGNVKEEINMSILKV